MADAHPRAWKNPLAWRPHSIAESALSTAPSAFPYDAEVANWLDAASHSDGAMLLRCVRTESAPVRASRVQKSGQRDRGTPPCGVRRFPPMTFSTNELEDGARAATGLDDFDSPYYREGFDRTVDALNTEADLNDLGQVIQHATMGMSFRTFHFDGVVRVAGYVKWLMGCDMPVRVFALDAFVAVCPNAKFLWSHRDPAKVLGSVCSLIAYVRSWSSDRKFGDDRFVDVSFADLQTDPVNTVARRYAQLGLTFGDAARGHKPGHRGTHTYDLADDGLTPEHVREAFSDYLGTYDASA